ncbi:Ig-like domain-containing protein [Epilithonimonas sp. UC225_85]|uniref:Ig-like domain-containing protein n=1 Tax=Epilithonimonas sp. UC225_85 TaxID=3350167 RepID=UPI0036D3B289
MMKKNFYVLFAILIANIFSAQSELVRWNQANLTPTNYSSNITSGNANSGFGISSQTWDVSFFQISDIPVSSTIDTSKYLQFSIAPNSNYQVNVSTFNLTYRAQSAGQKFEIRYSTNSDFSSPQTLTTVTTTDTNWHSLSQSNFTNPVIASGKTMYIRLYIYNGNYNSFHISNGNAGIAPNVSGTVTINTPVAPVANNDTFTVYKNNDADLSILSNDISSTSITAITITQQPAHGTLTVNGTTNVTYKPTTGYTGTDSFKYKSSNVTGASNEATVSLNVAENVASALVRWNSTDASASIYNNKVTSGNVTATQAITVNDDWENNINYKIFEIGGWPSTTTIDKTKYVQFTISPKSGYKLSLSDFNLLARSRGTAKIRIDYSLNSAFTNSTIVYPETDLGTALTTISLTNFPAPIATDGQVLYVRVYIYNTYNNLLLRFYPNNAMGPTFNGIVEYSSTVPIAYNDSVTTTINNDINVNVLSNDDYSNQVTSMALTQPSHGVTTLNADKSINYLPANNYSGTDSFTYNITNQYGVSNYATVNVNVTANNPTVLTRWDNSNYTATSFQDFVNPTQMTVTGVSLTNGNEATPVFNIGNLENSNAINTSKYVQFVLDNTSTQKTIEPKTFSFIGRGTATANYEIRYSKTSDFSSGVSVLSTGTFGNSYQTNTFNFETGLKLNVGEKLYIRLYLYNSYSQYLFQYYSGATGPEIGGVFYNSVYSSTDTIWQNAAAPHWSNGTPTADKNAIIDTAYNTASYGNFESKNLTINSGASITINADSYITVNGQIVNNAAATNFVVECNANLLQKGDAQNTGNVTVKKSATIPKMGYNYWSSPVNGQNLYQFSDGYNQATTTGTGTPWNRFYVYNEANDYFVTSIANDITLSSTSVFQPSRGYAIRGKNSFPDTVTSTSPVSEFKFTGTPQNGEVKSYILKWTNAAHGYNMVGNPYPSNLDFEDLFAANSTKIYGVAYFWTNNDGHILTQQGSSYVSNNYALYNGTGGASATYFGYNNRKPNGYISIGQGFIVQAKQAGKNQALVFNNGMRYAGNGNFYNKNNGKAIQKDRFWLEFKSPTNVNNEILLGYIPTATDSFDSDFDTELLAVGNDSFWSILDNKKLGIQARQAPMYNGDVVKLGIKASVTGNYTITLTDKEGIFNTTQDIYLKDTYLNKLINLKNEAYTFSTTSGQYEDRFQIIYKNIETLGTDTTMKKGIMIYKDLQNFVVKSDENLENVSLYDSLGRLIFSSKNAKKEVLIDKTNLAEGMYIIKADSRNTTMTKKVLK